MKFIKGRLLVIFLFLVVIISLSAVSAGDFTDLQADIDKSESILNINEDYTFNNNTDVNKIAINKTNFTIEGNGHYIDGNNQAKLFQIINSENITINNINFINGNGENYFLMYQSSVILNNVTFKNNTGEINVINTALNIIDSNFINNINLETSIYKARSNMYISTKSTVTIISTNFRNSLTNYGEIYAEKGGGKLTVLNSTFTNLTSTYASAIWCRETDLIVNNSKFYNLKANQSAGAIAIYNTKFLINNCEFINTSSTQNGGAIVINNCYNAFSLNETIINNSKFYNCSSNFAGAILSLGWREKNTGLMIDNCTFVDNKAKYDGGAIYASYNTFNLRNSLFLNNYAGEYGGALYLDMNYFTLNNSEISNNIAISEGGAIYIYESNLTIIKSNLNKNTDTGIYAVFLGNYSFIDSKINDTISLNNTYYNTVFIGEGAPIILVNNTFNVTTNTTKFDLRDYGLLTPIKDQGSVGCCWAFGAISAIESALIKNTNVTRILSVNNIKDLMIRFSIFGHSIVEEGASIYSELSYALGWFGLINDTLDPMDQIGKISPLILENNIHLQDAIFIPPRNNATDNDIIKQAIIDYGPLTVFYCHDNSLFNANTSAYYYNGTSSSNHIVCVVGWDDNYSKDNFLITPPGDGAFIVQNSWGEEWGDKGYFYVSYYDTSFTRQTDSIAYLFKNNISYNKNYQVDYTGLMDDENDNYDFITVANSTINYYANSFTSVGNDSIAAVGTYFNQSGVDYEISVYVNNELRYTQKGISEFRGFSTIKLNKYIPVGENDVMFVTIKSNAIPISFRGKFRHNIDKNTSFISQDGENWIDMTTYNGTVNNDSLCGSPVCLKVYTVKNSFNVTDLVKYYGGSEKFYANLGIANETVIFEINGINYTFITNEEGVASIPINLNSGKYNITTYALNQAKINVVTIKSTLIGNDTTLYYRNGSSYWVHALDSNGQVISGQVVKMNINGVFYERITDEEGNAYLPIGLNAGTYIITGENPLTGEKKSNNITVLPTITGKDLTIYHRNGSGYSVKVVDGQGNPAKGVTVRMNINGVFYNVKTDNNGVATLLIGLNPGDYIITAEYNGFKTSDKITVLPVLTGNDIRLYYRDGTSYKVKLVDGQGNPLTGVNVTMNINGVFYYRTTGINGVADLPIGLLPGQYIITTSYEDHSTSNTITVLERDFN